MLANATIAGVFRPCEKSRALIYDITLIIGGSLLLALCAHIKIHLGFSPVPITAQTFAVLIIGVLLGARRGSMCVLVYLIEGIAGLPVFAAAQKATIAVLIGPTGGYLVGFVAAAYVTGTLAEKGWDRRVWTTVLAMVAGNAVIYAFGLTWLICLTGAGKAVLAAGLYPFIPGDLLKIALAAVTLPSGWKLLEKANLPAEASRHRKDT